MPLGTPHVLEGLLLSDTRGGLVLRLGDGGEWRLDAGWRARRLVGRRVRVEGTRAGFDLLDVTSVKAVSAA